MRERRWGEKGTNKKNGIGKGKILEELKERRKDGKKK